jgi:hypothetical protein
MSDMFGITAFSLALVSLFALQNTTDEFNEFKAQVCQEIVLEVCE